MSEGQRRVDALDGLRGVAVLAVLAFHLAALQGGNRDGLLGGGWLGVDVFFTLSGYLITSLLLTELARTGRIDLRQFWRRRLRRLQPAALVAIVGIVGTARWWAPAGAGSAIREQAVAALGAVANWHSLLTDRAYAAAGRPSGFEHFWSLAVEEQFYLAWPVALTVVAAVAARTRRPARLLVAGLALGGVAVSWLLLARFPLQRGYLGTDARMGAILLGAALAALLPMDRAARTNTERRWATGAVWAGLGLTALLLVVAGWPPRISLAVLLPLQGLATTAILAGLVLAPHSAAARGLAAAPLAGIGRVSYGLYLWHWPVFVLLTPNRLGMGWAGTTTVRLVVVAALTYASWRLVEQPIRFGNLLPRTGFAFPIAAVVVVATAWISVRAVGPTPAWAQARGDLVVHDTSSTTDTTRTGRPTRVLVVGDSIATSLTSGPTGTLQMATGRLFDELAARGITAASATITGCPVIDAPIVAEGEVNRACMELLRRKLPAAMDEFRPDLVVWYSRQEAYPILLDGEVTRSRAALLERYADRLRWFAERGAQVLLVSPGPNADDADAPPPDGDPATMIELDRTLTEVARDHPGTVVGVVRMAELLCGAAEEGCPDCHADGTRFRYDGVHFLSPASDPVSAWLAERIAAVPAS